MNKKIKDLLDYIIILIVILLIRSFLVTPAIVDGNSMDTTLEDGQVVLINKYKYKVSDIERFDIVVINNETDNDRIIKRVIGLPNETIKYKNNILYINGKRVDVDFEYTKTSDFEITTKDGEYFVLGDNRVVSKDSRILGNFTKDDIVGKVNIRLFPFNKFGSID